MTANLRTTLDWVALIRKGISPAAVDALVQALGSAWAERRSSAVLAVPSAVIPAETNYLLNPLHPAFGRISIGAPQELITDLRRLRR